MRSLPIPKVVGIASGKGGVGKTTVSVNLAVALVQAGKRVMLLDADLGLANTQIALGAHTPLNIGHVLRGERSLEEIIITTPKASGWYQAHRGCGRWRRWSLHRSRKLFAPLTN